MEVRSRHRAGQLLALGLIMTEVSCTHGITINIGNFQSYRIDFGVKDDVREGESAAEAASRIDHFIEAFLEKKVKQVMAERRGE